MARSFAALNAMYAAGTFENVGQIVQTLQTTDQAMTFKELGVISTSGEVWRPKATKLYNFMTRVDLIDLTAHRDTDISVMHSACSEGHQFLCTSIDIPSDPIFNGINRKIVGSKVSHSGH